MDENKGEISEELTANGEKSGVQAENADDSFQEPFNPREISITSKVISLDAVIRRIRSATIHLAPNFQRKAVWDEKRKSLLIESLMLNIPIAIFYVADDGKGNWEVVDGLQRLTAIQEFVIDKTLKLTGLEFWKDYQGKTIDDLPPIPYNQIMETQFNFVIIEPGTHEAVKYNIFKRINTGGMPLSGQEIRHALYQGKGTDLLAELAQTENFLLATDRSVKDSRMAARELILRFLSFLILGTDGYINNDNMEDFLRKGLQILNHLDDLQNKKLIKEYSADLLKKVRIKDYQLIRNIFDLGMLRNYEIFGNNAFRISLQNHSPRSPINKGLFETWGCSLAELSGNDYQKLTKKKDILLSAYEQKKRDDFFYRSVSRDAWKKPNVDSRFQTISDIIRSTINA
ncbi:hypothetical protein AGMMS50293_25410 [Spirochaetia bacterium]|nr:hypothetical protein AGMMS50293_25410 [Spirochaetia bacterium]